MYGPGAMENGKIVSEETLQTQTPGYLHPWRGDLDGGSDPEKGSSFLHSKKKRRSLLKRWQVRILLFASCCVVTNMSRASSSYILWCHWCSA